MNRKFTNVSTLLAALFALGEFSQAQEEATEPLELTRLREQFQARVDQEMIPWRDKYKKELQKLEDRLIQERRLSEALAVKKERDYNSGLSGNRSVAGPAMKAPDSVADAKKALAGTVWLIYAADDKKREKLLDVYHFADADSGLAVSTKQSFEWSLKSASQVSLQFPAAEVKLTIDFPKSLAQATCNGKDFICIHVGSSEAVGR
jgi:hypothetical protein